MGKEDLAKVSAHAGFAPRILQGIAWGPTNLLLRIFLSFRVSGRENVKKALKESGKEKGIIFVANHSSELDPIMVRAALPLLGRMTPLFYVSGNAESYKHIKSFRRLLYGGFFFKLWGAYPVYSGKKDYKYALRNHIALLGQGRSVLIFPEGGMTRDGKMREARGGVGYLAHEWECPVVPVSIEGAFGIGERGFFSRKSKISLAFGEAVFPEDLSSLSAHGGLEDSEMYKEIATRIMDVVRAGGRSLI